MERAAHASVWVGCRLPLGLDQRTGLLRVVIITSLIISSSPLTLSMSMSNSWLMPTMLMFMSSAEHSAASSACTAAGVAGAPASARQLMLLTLSAVPSIVCGRLKPYSADRKLATPLSVGSTACCATGSPSAARPSPHLPAVAQQQAVARCGAAVGPPNAARWRIAGSSACACACARPRLLPPNNAPAPHGAELLAGPTAHGRAEGRHMALHAGGGPSGGSEAV